MANAVILNACDNVVNAITDIGEQEPVTYEGSSEELMTKTVIPFGFKLASKRIAKGESVIKYGVTIGKAIQQIEAGELVHVHNMEGCRGRGDLSANEDI